jgi:hypothetical protein
MKKNTHFVRTLDAAKQFAVSIGIYVRSEESVQTREAYER